MLLYTLEHNSPAKLQVTAKLKAPENFSLYGLQGPIAQEEICKLTLDVKQAAIFRMIGTNFKTEGNLTA